MESESRWAARPRLYFNLRSPYSWLALHDLGARHPDLLQQLDWRPFWDPSPESEALLQAAGGRFIYTPMSREKHLYVLYDVRRLAGERGLQVRWPVDRNPLWEAPHLAFTVAARSGRGIAYAVAASRARWEHGRNICDPAVVAQIGAEVDVDLTAVPAPDDQAMDVTGTGLLMDAYRDGVFGVPFFVYRHDKFWGLDRLDAFVRSIALGKVLATPAAVPTTVAMGAGDDGHAGGCG